MNTKLNKAFAAIQIRHKFFGAAIMKMPWQPNPTAGTAYTDGETVQYCPNFVSGLSHDMTVGLILHEICHPFLCHLSRLENQFKANGHMANVAADYELNNFLVEYNEEATHPIVLPEGALVDLEKWGTRSAESIFKEMSNAPEPDDGGGGDDSKPDDGGGGDDSKPDDGGGGDSKPDDCGGDSKPAPSKPSTTFGEFRPPKDPVKARKLQDEWTDILQSSIQTAKLRGEGGGKFVQKLENLMESPLDLTTLLERYVCDFCLSDDSTSPDRRYLADWDMCVTGMESERHGTLVFVKDTSGSINQEILESCVSVIQGAMDTLNFDKLVVMDVDTKVCDVQEYYRNDEVPATAKGRGGTDFRPAFTYVDEEVPEARVLIYLTDGYGPFPDEEPDVPTLWITYGIDVDQFPFGQAVDLKNLAL